MSSRHCTKCDTLNSVSREGVCSFCGWESEDLTESTLDSTNQEELDRYRNANEANANIWWGFLWVVGGCAFSIATHLYSMGGGLGGWAFVFFGPVIYGGLRVLSNFLGATTSMKIISLVLVVAIVGINYWFYFNDGQYEIQKYWKSPVEVGACLNEETKVVECGSDSAEFTVLELINIEESDRPSYQRMESYVHQCPLYRDLVVPPNSRTWDLGDRYVMCLQYINSNTDVIQKYYHSPVDIGACLNHVGVEVRCESKSAGYVVAHSIKIEESALPSAQRMEWYTNRCHAHGWMAFTPERHSWDAGHRHVNCVVSK